MALEEVKNSYIMAANIIPNWKDIDKNELARLTLKSKQENSPLYENYLSALICVYWWIIGKNYNLSKKSASIEECYDWFIDAILLGIKTLERVKEGDPLYDDPNAPDKVFNRCFYSMRMGFYQWSNADKRKLNYGCLSLDSMVNEDDDENYYPSEMCSENEGVINMNIENLIKHKISINEPAKAVLIDVICFQINTDEITKKLNEKKIVTFLSTLNEDYINQLKIRYNISDTNVVEEIRKNFMGIPNQKLYTKVRKILKELTEDKEVLECI